MQFNVLQIVRDHVEQGWQADEIQRQHPTLTLGQVDGALAYYYDHKARLDRMMSECAERAEHILSELPHSPMRARLRQAKQRHCYHRPD